MGISKTFGESFKRAIISSGNKIFYKGKVFFSINDPDKLNAIPIARDLQELGYKIVATHGTSRELNRNGIPSKTVFKVGEGRPNILDHIMNNEIQMMKKQLVELAYKRELWRLLHYLVQMLQFAQYDHVKGELLSLYNHTILDKDNLEILISKIIFW